MKVAPTSFTRVCLTAVVVLSLLAGVPGAAHAATAGAATADRPATRAGFTAAVARLDPYVVRAADGTLAVRAPAAVLRSIRPADIEAVRASLAATNADIRDGLLVADVDGSVHAAADPRTPAVARANAVTWNWWGALITLDAPTSEIVVGAVRAAAGVTTILGILVDAGVISAAVGVAVTVAGAILTLLATALAACTTEQGMDLYVTYVLLSWCRQPAVA